MALVGYGMYDNVSGKPKDAEIFFEHWETLYPEGAIEYMESETTYARAELRVDENGYWWARYVSDGDSRVSEVHDSEYSAWDKYQELASWVSG